MLGLAHEYLLQGFNSKNISSKACISSKAFDMLRWDANDKILELMGMMKHSVPW